MQVDIKNIKAILLLAAFLFLRVGSAHSISHWYEDTDTEHCELCDIISQSQDHTYFIDGESVLIENDFTDFTYRSVFQDHYEQPLHCFVLPRCVYNKPPPIW